MAIADLIFLAIVAISAIIGLFRGFVRESLSLAAWVLAFFVAFRFGPQGADFLEPYISVPSVRMATAYAVLFLVTLIVCAIINFFIGKMVRATGFSGTDRVLGLVFGMARGVAVILIVIMLARLTVVREDPWWKESLFIQYLEPWAEQILEWLPEDLDKQMNKIQPSSGSTGSKPADQPSSNP